MKILVVSDNGVGRGLSKRLDREGHDVKYGRPDLSDWRPDIVIYDTGAGDAKEADGLRNAGFKVIGPSKWSAAIQEDKTYLSQIIASLGWNANGLHQGTNVYISGWFNGSIFINTYVSIVYRRFMAGGAGPDLSCTGVLSNFAPTTPKTYYSILAPLENNILKKVNHRGPLHIHLLVNKDRWCVKEIITDFLNPISLPLFENVNNLSKDLILGVLEETSKPIRTLNPWASAVQMSVPPFPYNYSNEYREIRGLSNENLKHLWLADVEESEGKHASAGLIGYVTARGFTHSETVRRMYRTLSNISAKDMQFRNDVGRDVQPLLVSLKQGGWI